MAMENDFGDSKLPCPKTWGAYLELLILSELKLKDRPAIQQFYSVRWNTSSGSWNINVSLVIIPSLRLCIYYWVT
jgi:hypothetical protein